MSVVRYIENIFYICGVEQSTDIFDESVFAQSFIENVVVFMEERATDDTHS